MSPSGQLYAENACEFLAHDIIHSHLLLALRVQLRPPGD
jgi:hypothetical protein